MANFNVRISDDLADSFDAWAATEGGRSPALRLLIDRVCAGSPTRRADRLPHRPFKLTVRLTAADGDGLAQAAAEMGLTPNAWVAALVRRRLHDRPTFRRATRMGVTNPENGPGTYIKADPCETIWACMKRLTGWFDEGMTEGQFHRMDLRPAEFYPRMARPIALADRDSLGTRPWTREKAYVAGPQAQ